jgi:hypothetical protein
MTTTEHTINDTLATVLRTTCHAWRDSDIVRSEQLGMLKESFARPDILVVEPNVSPVAIDAIIAAAPGTTVPGAAQGTANNDR